MPSAPRPSRVPVHAAPARTEPFTSAEEAWFWTMAALVARRDGARIVSGRGLVARPCEPDDVVRCLDRLYRQRRIDLAHARILRIWGERGSVPDPRVPRERGDWTLWREAMARLEWPLRIKGIVAGGIPTPAPGEAMADMPGAAARILPFPAAPETPR